MKALFSTYMRECKDVFTYDYLPTLRKIGSVLGAVLFYTVMVIAAIMMFTIAPFWIAAIVDTAAIIALLVLKKAYENIHESQNAELYGMRYQLNARHEEIAKNLCLSEYGKDMLKILVKKAEAFEAQWGTSNPRFRKIKNEIFYLKSKYL